MKCQTWIQFKNALNSSFSIFLISSKEEYEQERALREILKGEKKGLFYSLQNFSLEAFSQELETVSLWEKQKTIVLQKIEDLASKALDWIYLYCQNPNSQVRLILISSSFTSQNKIVKASIEKGIAYLPSEEKPWEKEKNLALWLIEEAQNEGVEIEEEAAYLLVKGLDVNILKNEIEKLICYVGKKKTISLSDVQSLSSFATFANIWQLVDALFERERERSLSLLKTLIVEEGDIFALLSSIRAQFYIALRSLILFEEQGASAVIAAFPYLKGSLLDKKLRLYRNYGKEKVRKSLYTLFETEVHLKSGNLDPKITLEILVARL